MTYQYKFDAIRAASLKARWEIEDILTPESRLDFNMHFLPEGLARTEAIEGLTPLERRTLNHIRGHDYLSTFGLVEEFILPFVLDHARPQLNGDDERVRALLGFAEEEAKHIQLFKNFHRLFTNQAGYRCDVIGPPEAVAAEVLRHDPLSVAMVILMIEWFTQSHYLEEVKGGDIDPLFASLLRHHWMEEAQHAKLDTLMVQALAENRDEDGIQKAVDGFLEIGMFLDNGLKQQAIFNLEALERATGWQGNADEREAIIAQQHQALRWTFLGSGLVHPQFRKTIGDMSPRALERLDEVAPAFA